MPRSLLATALLTVILAACSSPGAGGPPVGSSLAGGIGTFNYDPEFHHNLGEGGKGTAFYFVLDLESAAASVDVTVAGPADWNDGSLRVVRENRAYAAGLINSWHLMFTPPIAGRYTVEAIIDGRKESFIAEVDPSQILPKATGVNFTQAGGTAALSWTPVEGAVSYLVRLNIWTGSDWTRVTSEHTTETSIEFSGLPVAAGDEPLMGAYVYAFAVDLANPQMLAENPVFNASRIWYEFPKQ